jgi:hypothetical protein
LSGKGIQSYLGSLARGRKNVWMQINISIGTASRRSPYKCGAQYNKPYGMDY